MTYFLKVYMNKLMHNMLKLLTFIICWCLYFHSYKIGFSQNSGSLFNRAIVEIYNKTYTQMDIELYIIIKRILNSTNPTLLKLEDILTKALWNNILKEFVIDIIIENELQTSTTYILNSTEIEQSIAKLKEIEINNPSFKHIFENMNKWHMTLRPVVIWILRIEFYKNKNTLQITNIKKMFENKFNQKMFIINLDQNKFCRFYDDAFIYQNIMLTSPQTVSNL